MKEIDLKAFRGSSRVIRVVSRVALIVREGIGSFAGIQGKQQS
jgi:hypothetical protein